MGKKPLAQFDRGQKVTVACINRSPHLADADFRKMVAAAQVALDSYFTPVWGQAATLQIVDPKTLKPNQVAPDGMWACVFWDNADVQGALGYHDLTQNNLPLSHIFVLTSTQNGGAVSVTFTHELFEMLGDPGIQMYATNYVNGQEYAYETCDAVEETDFQVNGVRISNFQYPSWFESFRKPKSTQFDFMNLCQRPFQLLKGGYSIIKKSGQESQIFGSEAKKQRFAKEDRRHHRSEFRKGKLKMARAALRAAKAKSAKPGVQG